MTKINFRQVGFIGRQSLDQKLFLMSPLYGLNRCIRAML